MRPRPWPPCGVCCRSARSSSARALSGRHQRMRDLLSLRRLHDLVEGGPARREPLRDRRAGRGLGGPAAGGRAALPLGGRAGDRDRRGVTDLIVRGGTVVTAAGAATADVAVEGGRIAAVGPDLGSDAREVVDAAGLLVLPGAVDVHTHVRIASDAEPDRFFQDSVAAAFGGTTTFLAFNNPGTGGSPAAGRTPLDGLRPWRAPTEGDAAGGYRTEEG